MFHIVQPDICHAIGRVVPLKKTIHIIFFQANQQKAKSKIYSLADPRPPPGSKFFHFHAVIGKKIEK